MSLSGTARVRSNAAWISPRQLPACTCRLPTPMTRVTRSREAAAEVVQREARPFVLKPLFGSQGRGLRLLHSELDLPAPAEVAGVYYLRRFVRVEPDGFRDFGFLLVWPRGRCHDATLLALGDKCEARRRTRCRSCRRHDEDLAVAATAVVGANFASVDRLRSRTVACPCSK